MTTKNTFAEPAPLGLLGLAIGCASLVPIAFGHLGKNPAATFETCAWMCLLFGGGCQLLAGVMALANKNMLGGTLFTAFAFNWGMNFWALDGLAHGKAPDATVVLAADVAFLVIFVVLTFAFALVSKMLFLLLLDLDVLYGLRIAHVHGAAIGVATIALAAISMTIALATMMREALALRVTPPVRAPRSESAPAPEQAPAPALA